MKGRKEERKRKDRKEKRQKRKRKEERQKRRKKERGNGEDLLASDFGMTGTQTNP